jgi:hypothetical protein
MTSRDAKAVLIGLGWLMVVFGSTTFFGALGYWLWGDLGIMLSLTPVGVAYVLVTAFLIGDSDGWKGIDP